MTRKNILIYPSGAENAIEVNLAIRNSVHIHVVPATAASDHSDLVYGGPVEFLPNVQDNGFVDALNELIHRRGIDLIFPTHDTVALFLAEARERINCGVITSEALTVRVCRYKRAMYEALKDLAACPRMYDLPSDQVPYPIFAKPNVGQGAVGVRLVHSREQHATLVATGDDLVFVDYLPGKEFTVDCFTDRHGMLRFCGPRERSEVRMGISFRSRSATDRERFTRIAEAINGKLRFRGLWFFQVKEDASGELKLLEVSARVAGTMGYFRHKGVNLPLLSVFDALDMDVEVRESGYDVELYRSTRNRYRYAFEYTRVYLDFDDTVIVNGKVCLDVIAFVYHCLNAGKEVHLLTRHEHDIHETLERYHIASGLFTSIVQVPVGGDKADHIDPLGAIFIDNWYRDRRAVQDKHGIPVFDVDAVASLVNG